MNDEGRFRFRKYNPKNSSSFIITFADFFVIEKTKQQNIDIFSKRINSLDARLLKFMPSTFAQGFEQIDVEEQAYKGKQKHIETQFIASDPYFMNLVGTFIRGIEPYKAIIQMIQMQNEIDIEIAMNMVLPYDIDTYRKNRKQSEEEIVDLFNEHLAGLSLIYSECFETKLLDNDTFNDNMMLVKQLMLEDMETKPGIYLVGSGNGLPPDTGLPQRQLIGGPKIYTISKTT